MHACERLKESSPFSYKWDTQAIPNGSRLSSVDRSCSKKNTWLTTKKFFFAMEDKSGYASINSAFSYIVQGRII